MAIIDKHNLLSGIERGGKIVIELGCGPHKKIHGAIGVDAIDYEAVDIVGDVFEVLRRVPDNSIDEIHSFHFIEHVNDLPVLLDEMARIVKPSGNIMATAPHFSNPYFYSDYTHKQFFGLYSFSYLAMDRIFKRRVPSYQRTPLLELVKVQLVFRSPFHFRSQFKKLLGKIVNFNIYTMELYEENFCYLFPCYEVSYRLKKLAL